MHERMEKSRELIQELLQNNAEKWLHYGFLSYQWWILLAFLIVPWLIWLKAADKKRRVEVLLAGTIVMLITTVLDWIGYHLNFWDYPIELVPLLPGAFPFDFSMVPVPYMLLYQYLRTWKTYGAGLICMAVLYAFVGEPLSNMLMLVVYIKSIALHKHG